MFGETRRVNDIVEMYPNWTSKKASPIRYEDTHASIFIQPESTVNPLRTAKLFLEDKRDRHYNILSGESVSLF
jgi:hypothetical protein